MHIVSMQIYTAEELSLMVKGMLLLMASTAKSAIM